MRTTKSYSWRVIENTRKIHIPLKKRSWSTTCSTRMVGKWLRSWGPFCRFVLWLHGIHHKQNSTDDELGMALSAQAPDLFYFLTLSHLGEHLVSISYLVRIKIFDKWNKRCWKKKWQVNFLGVVIAIFACYVNPGSLQ